MHSSRAATDQNYEFRPDGRQLVPNVIWLALLPVWRSTARNPKTRVTLTRASLITTRRFGMNRVRIAITSE
jgi:hypothetical protein